MLYIRTDMNNIIATGHVMRCIAIADAAKSMGENTTFLLSDDEAVQLLNEKGYPYIVLHTSWDDMEAELPVLEAVIDENEIKRIFVDSYQVTKNYLEQLSTKVETIYLDDVNAFVYPVDKLICYANYWEKFGYKETYDKTKLYLGTKYVPLRKEFFSLGQKKINQQVERLLMLSGGTDRYNVLERFLECIDRKQYQQIDVICGAYYANYAALREKYITESNVQIHQSVTNIEQYMKAADLAISAGGTTLYELCACGTPTISFAIADNQLENVRQFQEDKIIDYAGDVRSEDVVNHLAEMIREYSCNQELRRNRSLKMQEMIDGRGALRIAELLVE